VALTSGYATAPIVDPARSQTRASHTLTTGASWPTDAGPAGG